MENVYLIFGCFGRKDNKFVLCPSVENRILKLDNSLTNLDDIMDYLEQVQLFDRVMLDWNAICHLLYNLQERFDQKVKRLWTQQEYNLLERFLHSHRQCGLYMKLIVTEEIEEEKPELKRTSIKGSPEEIERKPNLKLVGRR